MTTGTVKFFNTTKGFGFISPDDGTADLFVHISAVERADMQTLVEGQRLSFQVEGDAKGAKAIKLERLDEKNTDAAPISRSQAGDALGLTIYHNPDCPLSRNALSLIEEQGHAPRIVDYMKNPLTSDELRALAGRLKLKARDLARTYEPLYEELKLADAANDDEILDAIAAHPVLLNRPIVTTISAARLCRPSNVVKGFLSEIANG
jgi:arsenate reductase